MNFREKKIFKYFQMALPKKKLNASFVMKDYRTVPLFNRDRAGGGAGGGFSPPPPLFWLLMLEH